MEPRLVTELIDDIVGAVYPESKSVRERYLLAQSLHLLVFIAERKPKKNRDNSTKMMRATIERMMQRPGL